MEMWQYNIRAIYINLDVHSLLFSSTFSNISKAQTGGFFDKSSNWRLFFDKSSDWRLF